MRQKISFLGSRSPLKFNRRFNSSTTNNDMIHCFDSIGFIGLGNMGTEMAWNLVNRYSNQFKRQESIKHKFIVYDNNSTAIDRFLNRFNNGNRSEMIGSISVANSPKHLAQQVSFWWRFLDFFPVKT